MLEWIIGAFALFFTLYMLIKGHNLGIIMIVDSLAVALAVKMPFSIMGAAVVDGLFSMKTIGIILSLIFILMLENMMQHTGMIKQMVSSLQALIQNQRIAAILLPMFIGLLPSPGGARFSCTMVQETVGDELSGTEKAFVNYWFRHAWLDAFILYPGIILAAQLLELPVVELFLYMVLFMLVNMVVGLMLLGKNHAAMLPKQTQRASAVRGFVMALLPVLSVIALYLLLMNRCGQALAISCAAVVAVMALVKRCTWTEFKGTLKHGLNLYYISLIAGVMIFVSVLSASGLLENLTAFVTAYHIPVRALYIILPMSVTLLSGLSINAISITFPILISLGLKQSPMLVIAAAYMSAVIGLMLSPTHLCAVFSAEYFKTELHALLKKCMLGELIMLMVVIGIMLFA